jgi:hypothetical protein
MFVASPLLGDHAKEVIGKIRPSPFFQLYMRQLFRTTFLS